MIRAALTAATIAFAAPVAAEAPVLTMPIDCTLGVSCHIQHFVDRDPGPAATDFRCGTLAYDGHKGTDFALPSLADMRRGVNVLAAAPGVVTGRRDGMADSSYSDETASEVDGRECGNGVVLRHDDGWETQYCHMKSGSVRVAKGARVERGAILGQVGLSGKTQFPHVHLSVRHAGTVIDPFDTDSEPTCGEDPTHVLWADPPAYVEGGLIDIGFAPGLPDYDDIREGTAARSSLASDAQGVVLFAYAYGGQKGDVIALEITGPDGVLLTQDVALEKNQAQFFRAAGKRLRQAHWPAGTYTGKVQMRRGSTDLGQKTVSITID